METVRPGGEMRERELSTAMRDRASAFASFADSRLAEYYRLAAQILDDPSEAEDATHDAFELAWQRWDSLRDRTRLDAWFGRILVNVCRDRLRRRRRYVITDLSPDLAGSLTTGDDRLDTSDRDEIAHAFARLSADHRVVMVLRFYADLTVEQIAERVGAPAGTVKSRLHYALQEMNGALVSGRDEESRT